MHQDVIRQFIGRTSLADQRSLLVLHHKFEAGKIFVEVENGTQQFEKRFIDVGISDGIHIEVVKGLSKEDKVKVWNTP